MTATTESQWYELALRMAEGHRQGRDDGYDAGLDDANIDPSARATATGAPR